ncbi:MAG: hypothetical protein NC121_00510 [Blautia sp.]|nr:hypothetical protein [Blautia sp.]
MEKLKRILKGIFCLPPLPAVLFALFGYGFVLAVAIFEITNPILQYASYLFSAYALIITITGLPYVKTLVRNVKKYTHTHALMRRFRSTAMGEKYLTDIRFREGVSLYRGFFINLLYIVVKLVFGIYYRSPWFIALAVYYMLLAVMRLTLVRWVNVQNRVSEWKSYRMCGIMLLFMNQVLAGVVMFIVYQNRGFEYPGALIYMMAMYSFYMVITAVINVVKFHRKDSPVLSAVKAVNLVAAMVSILSLTTAMIMQFGGGDASGFRRNMTAAVGGNVCTIVIVMAVFMIVRSTRELKGGCGHGRKQ